MMLHVIEGQAGIGTVVQDAVGQSTDETNDVRARTLDPSEPVRAAVEDAHLHHKEPNVGA